jgi:glucokinase
MACLGAGTGLGECFLAPGDHGDYVCYPTEGGHCEFAPRDEVHPMHT